MKLTKAQTDTLKRIDRPVDDAFGGWVNWGPSCGVKRQVVRALAARGFAQMDEMTRSGVSCRITNAGRAALSEQKR